MSTAAPAHPSLSKSPAKRRALGHAQPPSPTTLALASLNMTRDDLARHTVQMRSFLNAAPHYAHEQYDEQYEDDDDDDDQYEPSAAPQSSTLNAPEVDRRSASLAAPTRTASMDAVLEGSQHKRKRSVGHGRGGKKGPTVVPGVVVGQGAAEYPPPSTSTPSGTVYTLPPPPARTSLSVEPSNASRASSVASSAAYQQDVFYSRPSSVAPSTALTHPSLRRSVSTSSRLSDVATRQAANNNDVEEEVDDQEEHDALVDQLLGLDQPNSQPNPAASAPAISATPSKRNPPQNATTPFPKLALPASSSATRASNIPSSSPVYHYPVASPNDPRTPYKAPHNVRTAIIPGRRPPNAVMPSSSPMPVPVTSSPAGVEGSPSNPASMPFKLPGGPRLTSKPHYSYAALIGQALTSSTNGKLSLNQIYTWISLAYPYFKRGESGWQNSIRHNLSLNGCFVKIKRDDGEKGKGSWWAIREGDEPCFAGGGFQRQGRANGRKRKGKADKEGEDQAKDEAAEEAEDAEAGASPKKKKKTTTAPTTATLPLPRSYARSMSTSTATSVHTMASTTSFDSGSSAYTGAGYYYPPATGYVAPYGTARLPPPVTFHVPPASSQPQSVNNDDNDETQEEEQELAQTSHVRTPATQSHVRTHASQGYVLRADAMAAPSSPLATRSTKSSRSLGTSEDEDDLESEDDQAGDSQPQPAQLYPAAAVAEPTKVEEMEAEEATALEQHEQEPAPPPLPPVAALLPQLGQPITLQESAPAPEPSTNALQAGFKFIPPAPKDKDVPMTDAVKQETMDEDDRQRVEVPGLPMTEEEQFDSFFSSSPIVPPAPRGRTTSLKGGSLRSLGGTDLQSRVLESKSVNKRSGHSTSSSTSKFLFPAPPSTPSRKRTITMDMDHRPSTPPPKTVNEETERLLKNLDPTTAAAVTALASLSPMRTPVSHAAFHMSPAAPPSSDLTHYKHSLGPPSPFRTPGRTTSSGSAGRAFDYYDFLNDGPSGLADDLDKTFGGGKSSGMGMGVLGHGGVPRTPATPSTSGLFGSHSLYQSPSLPSPGWRRY